MKTCKLRGYEDIEFETSIAKSGAKDRKSRCCPPKYSAGSQPALSRHDGALRSSVSPPVRAASAGLKPGATAWRYSPTVRIMCTAI